MKKGFIFSLSAFYYVLLFLIFLSVFMVAYFNFSYKDKVNDFTFIKKVDFFTESNIPRSTPVYWCSVYYKYDPDDSLKEQTTPEKREYCEGYDKERLF
jgi:hypothetical protein